MIVVLLAAACARIDGQDAKQIVQQAVQAEIAADQADHTRWLYLDVYRKPGQSLRQWIVQTSKGDLKRVVEENGHTLSESEQRSRIQSYTQDADAQAKERKSGQADDNQARKMLEMLPQAFKWTVVQKKDDQTVLHFTPDPQFHPPSFQARVFAGMEGDMTVAGPQHRIASLKGHLVHDVKFVGGLLGDLQAGGSFDVERRETGDGVWQITETHVHIAGRALLFKSISDEEDDVKTKLKEIPPNLSLADAENTLMTQKQ